MTNTRYFMYSDKDTDCVHCKNTYLNNGCGYCTECKCNSVKGCYCVLEHENGVEHCPYYEGVKDD